MSWEPARQELTRRRTGSSSALDQIIRVSVPFEIKYRKGVLPPVMRHFEQTANSLAEACRNSVRRDLLDLRLRLLPEFRRDDPRRQRRWRDGGSPAGARRGRLVQWLHPRNDRDHRR